MSNFNHRNDARLEDAEDFDVRSRRLQLIVYSSLVAFVVLAVYGFWLITSLTRDVSRLVVEMSAMTRTIDREMVVMATKMGDIDDRMVTISDNMVMMNRNIGSMTRDFSSMNANIRSMASDTTTMAGSTLNMQRDMWSLNRNVSGPLGMMNMFNPMGNSQGPFPGSAGPYYPQHAVGGR
jgi:methyl-accepting chemotaxis protein